MDPESAFKAGQPDVNFVLNGRKTPIRMKSNGERTYLTNSEKTVSSHNLSLTSLNRSGSDWDTINVLFDSADSSRLKSMKKSKEMRPKSNGEFSLDLKSLNSSLNKSVSFNNKMPKKNDESDDESLDDMFEEELQKLIDKDAEELDDQPHNLVGKPQSSYLSKWFTEPVHLTKSSEYPVFESLGVDVQKTSPKNRTVGMLGTELAQNQIKSDVLRDDDLFREHFPATFRSTSIAKTFSSPPKNGVSVSSHRPRSAKSEPRNMTYSRRPQSATITSKGSSRMDRSSYGDYLDASLDLVNRSLSTTPNEYELAKLRMERLRLEEERILETKRKEELERIRGPTPKWYELKTPHFTYEHFKHNQLLQSKKRWQELMDYRNKLNSSSKDFSSSHRMSQTLQSQIKRSPTRGSSSIGRMSTRSESYPVTYAAEFMYTTPVI